MLGLAAYEMSYSPFLKNESLEEHFDFPFEKCQTYFKYVHIQNLTMNLITTLKTSTRSRKDNKQTKLRFKLPFK